MESKIIKKLSINFDKEILVDQVLIDKEIVNILRPPRRPPPRPTKIIT